MLRRRLNKMIEIVKMLIAKKSSIKFKDKIVRRKALKSKLMYFESCNLSFWAFNLLLGCFIGHLQSSLALCNRFNVDRFRFCIGGINIKLGPSGIASRSLSVWLPLIQKNNFITVIMNKYYNSWYTNSLFSRSAMNKSGGKFEQLQALFSHWNKSVFTRRNSYPNNSYSNLLPYCTSVYTSFFFFFWHSHSLH